MINQLVLPFTLEIQHSGIAFFYSYALPAGATELCLKTISKIPAIDLEDDTK